MASDARQDEIALDAILAAAAPLAARGALGERALERILRRHPKRGRGFYSKHDLIARVRSRAGGSTASDAEQSLLEQLVKKPVRTLSGVAPVTVLTRPYPCPGECIFCPSDVRMPKSYIASEPGCQRAEANAFDPYLQTWNRLRAFHGNGHRVDKVELLVLGGTWSFYPEEYRRWFILRCFEALNDFGAGRDRRAAALRYPPVVATEGSLARGRYNRMVSRALRADGAAAASLLWPWECAAWEELQGAQRENETSACRCVGLVLETRPDHVSEAEVLCLRRLGATKIQIGAQSLSDEILRKNRRGHDVAASRRALRLLRATGFKLQVHWMANLYGATPAGDTADFELLFSDPDFRPDEIKLYPCSLIESAELMRFYQRGQWRPYTDSELLSVVTHCLAAVPRYCRVNRVIRDIPGTEIAAGSGVTNLRETAERELRARGVPLRDIRAREIRAERVDAAALQLHEENYATSTAREVFLEFVTPDDRIAAFARLSLPEKTCFLEELAGAALLRELHVYGAVAGFGEREMAKAQHAGLGRRLVHAAVARARASGYRTLSVISAVGTRGYYRALGFRDGELYQHLALD